MSTRNRLVAPRNVVNTKMLYSFYILKELSKGNQQKVQFISAIIHEPKLLILDEPATGLDYNITKELYKILAHENKENKMTIIMATHDLEEINEIKPRIITLAKTVKYDGDLEGWKGF